MTNAKQEFIEAQGRELATPASTGIATVSDSATLMSVISRAASDPSVDMDKLERLMEMYERIESKKSETAFNAAMSAAQSEMGRVATDATNPQTRSHYASYAAIDKALRPIYSRHGFALSFDEGQTEKPEHVRVLCHVSHRDGYTRTYHRDMPADGKGAKGGDVMTKTHAAGAAQSYGMRYLLKGIFNVAIGEDDDDGNIASTITDEQATKIKTLLEETDANVKAFLGFARAESVDAIRAADYGRCMDMLMKKKGAKK
jgi:hypothetical protein